DVPATALATHRGARRASTRRERGERIAQPCRLVGAAFRATGFVAGSTRRDARLESGAERIALACAERFTAGVANALSTGVEGLDRSIAARSLLDHEDLAAAD